MNERDWLAVRFEENRTHLRDVAYRMLGSLSEADDAVQDSWLRLSRSDTSSVENLGGWLTTVIARVCLDMLRSRKSRAEEPLDADGPQPIVARDNGNDPEHEAVLAESVGLALLVVLDTLDPAERLAFVLHDIFAVPFDEIAPIVGRSEPATRQLASRARRRVRGVPTVPDAELTSQREIVDAFLAAARAGDFEALLALLDPDVVFRPDPVRKTGGLRREVRGASAVGKLFAGRALLLRPALVNGVVGIVVAPQGRLFVVQRLTITQGKIVEIDVVADPARLRQLELAVLDD
jgi:RNA polymerase sigma factor (sigma-70 family)